MKLAPTLVAMIAVVAVSGCAPAPKPSAPITPTGTVTASTAPSPSAAASPTLRVPKVPTTSGAVDVSAHDFSAFASPSGAIWCAVGKNGALCHFPKGFAGKIPSGKTTCPDQQLDVTGVSVDKKVEYFCSGDPTAFPSLENAGGDLDWFPATGFPTVAYDGFTVATLPYGKKLMTKGFICLSETTGVTCGNVKTGVGFKMAKAGVTFIH